MAGKNRKNRVDAHHDHSGDFQISSEEVLLNDEALASLARIIAKKAVEDQSFELKVSGDHSVAVILQ